MLRFSHFARKDSAASETVILVSAVSSGWVTFRAGSAMRQFPAASQFAATARPGSHSHCAVVRRLNPLASVPETMIGHAQHFQPFLRSLYSEDRRSSGYPALHSRRWRQ
jgi:hypothetical protein